MKSAQIEGTSKAPKYFIDEAWYELKSRSFQHMIDSRIEAVEDPTEKPTERAVKRGKGKAAAAVSKTATMDSLSKVEGFIHHELSVLETVFRLLLVHRNKPMYAEEMSQELAEHGIGVMDTRVVNAHSLTRMLDADFHYGIRRHPGS